MGDEPLPIVSGLITAGSVRVEHMISMQVALADRSLREGIVIPSGPYLDMGRNKVCRRFYDERYADDDFLLMVDSDIQFAPEHIRDLHAATVAYHAEHDIWPLTGGVYQGINGGQKSIIAYDWHDVDLPSGDTERQLHNVPLDEIMDIPPSAGQLRRCGAFGTGFMLIHRSILDDLRAHYAEPQPWFIETPINGTWFGEDLLFCMRAEALNHPVFVHTGVRLTHYKEIGLAF